MIEKLESREMLAVDFQLVKDINAAPTSRGSSPTNIVQVGAITFFTASTVTHGEELWKSDGSEAGTVRVKDIRAGSGGSYPQNLTAVNGMLYFSAYDGSSGYELWKSDGSEAGTVRVKDIRAGSGSADPRNLTAVNEMLYFTADDGGSGWELWKSDGSETGTVRVKDIRAGSGSAEPRNLTAVNGMLYFTADDGGSGVELWKSDDSETGTVLAYDFTADSGGSNPSNLIQVGDLFFVTVTTENYGQELFVASVNDPNTDVSLDGDGNLLIADVAGGGKNDTLNIRSDTTNSQFVISDPNQFISTSIAGSSGSGSNTIFIPFSAVAGSQIIVDTLGGDDALTVDFSLGDFGKSIIYNGGTNDIAGDKLVLLGGGTFGNATYNYTNLNEGSILVSGNATITYTGLEPITSTITASHVTLNYSATSETITLTASGAGQTTVSSTAGELTTFNNPANSLTINAGDGNDTILVQGLGSGFSADLIIDGQVGTDSVTFEINPTSTAGGTISVISETINVHAALNAGSGAVNLTSTGNDTLLTISSSGSVSGGSNSTFKADKMAINGLVDLGLETLTLVPESSIDGGDAINIGSISNTASNTLELSNEELNKLTAGTIQIGDASTAGTITVSAAIIHTADKNFLVETTRNIVFSSGWTTTAGDLRFSANQQTTPTAGNFVGIAVSGATVSSHGTGNLHLSGRGGDSTVGSQSGVSVTSAGKISGGSGTLTVVGSGGNSTGNTNYGVLVFSTGSQITSSGGNVSVTGTGGGASTSGFNHGAFVWNAGMINAGGSGTLTVVGYGGNTSGTGDANYGVDVESTGSLITSTGGSVSVTGTGGGGSTSNFDLGVSVRGAAMISAGGSGTLTVVGNGGNTSGIGSANNGVHVESTGSQITSSGGSVSVTGTGGGAGTGNSNHGVHVRSAGVINAGGSGTLTVVGNGGNTTGSGGGNYGVSVDSAGSQITSTGGNVAVTGTGGGAGGSSNNHGVYAASAGVLSAGGSGTLTVVGNGGNTSGAGSSNYGVQVGSTGSQITSTGGNVSVTGTGGGGGGSYNNHGVYVWYAGVISASGSGTLTVVGNGGNTSGIGSSNYGVFVNTTGSQITSSGGNVSVTGTGGGAGGSSNNFGVYVASAGVLSAGVSGTLTVVGNGGNASGIGSSNYGVFVNITGSQITSSGGNVSVTGTGGGGSMSSSNHGVYVGSAGVINAGVSGTLTVVGNGGNTSGPGGGYNHGVYVNSTGSQITSTGGNVSVTGTGGTGSAGGNDGVFVSLGGQISAGGSGTVTIAGTGGTSGNSNNGLVVEGTGAAISSGGGAVQVTGTGGGSGTSTLNFGVWVAGGQITAGSNGSITVDGIGGSNSTGSNNHGIRIAESTGGITSSGGDVSVTGSGGTSSFGIQMMNSGTILATAGTPTVVLTTDSIDLSSTASIDAGANVVTVRPQTLGTQINLGGADAAATLSLSDVELDRITAASIQIGSLTAGPITVSASIHPALTDTLHLITGSGVTQSAGIRVAQLAVRAGGAVNLYNSQNDFDVLAVRTSSGSVDVYDPDGYTVGAVGSVYGITTLSGSINLNSFSGDIVIADTPAAVEISGPANYQVNINQFQGGTSVIVAPGAKLVGHGFTIVADRVLLDGTVESTLQTEFFTRTAGRAIDLGSTTDTAVALELSDAELDRVTASIIKIGRTTAGPITISQAINPALTSTLHLISGGVVTFDRGVTLADPAGDPAELNVAASAIQVNASLDVAGDITLTADTTHLNLGLASAIRTTGLADAGSVIFNGDVVLEKYATVRTDGASSGGEVTFLGAVDGNQYLEVRAGITNTAGGITFAGSLGSTVPLKAVIASSQSTVTLGGNISVDGGYVYLGETTTSVLLNASVTIDTEAGNDGPAGFVQLFNVKPLAPGLDLTIDTSTTAPGAASGTVGLGRLTGGPYYLNDVTVNISSGGGATGYVHTVGISLDDDGAGDAASFTVLGGGDVRLGQFVTIDTEQGDNGSGGSINLGGSRLFRHDGGGSADLTLDTSTSAAGKSGGDVTLGDVTDGGGGLWNDFTIHALGGVGGAGGVVTLAGNMTLDEIAGDASSLAISADSIFLSGTINASDVVVGQGTLRIGASQRMADNAALVLVTTSAGLDLNGFDEAIGSLSGQGEVSLGSGTLTTGANNASTTYQGVISGNGGLVKTGSGTFTLSGANTYAGTTVVSQGILELQSSSALGSTASETTVSGTGTVLVASGVITAEPFTVNRDLILSDNAEASGAIQLTGRLFGRIGSVASGEITLAGSAAAIIMLSAPGTFSIDGRITDLTGSSPLNLTTTSSGANIALTNTGNNYGGTTTLYGTGSVNLGAANVIPDTSRVHIADSTATLKLNDFSETVGALSGFGNVALGNGSLVTGVDNSSTHFAGIISGAGSVVKEGVGTWTLDAAHTFSGMTMVDAGKLIVGGSLASFQTFVNNGGMLSGAGTILGTVTINSGGTVSPGLSAGVLGTGSVNFAAGSIFEVDLNGTTAGSGYDQLNVTGGVALGGATLNVSRGFLPAIGTQFTLIANDDVDSVSGTFAGLAEGANLTVDGRNFVLTYAGGDGNDVVLTAVPTALYWQGDVDNLWSTAGNWLGDQAPIDGDLLVFDTSAAGFADNFTPANDLSNLQVGSLKVVDNSTTGNFTLSGNAIHLANGLSIDGTDAWLQTISLAGITLTAPQTFQAINGRVNVNSAIDNAGYLLTTDVASSSTMAINFLGDLSGSGGLEKTGIGPGGIGLQGPKSYTGLTNIIAGNIRLLTGGTLGDMTQGTVIAGNGSVFVDHSVPITEAFTVQGQGFQNTGTIQGKDGGVVVGPITLTGNTRFRNMSSGEFTISGNIDDQGGDYGVDVLVYSGFVLTLAGANTYSGATTVTDNATGGILRIGSAGAIPDTSAVNLGSSTAILDLNNFNETIGSLSGSGSVLLGSATLTTGGDNTSTTFSGVISGSGRLVKEGTGALTLSGAHEYAGWTNVNDGRLHVNGSVAGPVAVAASAVLGGTGVVGGLVTVNSGGTVSPGLRAGVLGTGSVNFAAGSILEVELNGTTVGGGYDQLNVTGSVALGGATLNVSRGFLPAIGTQFTLIANDGTDAVAGTFAGLAEGGRLTLDGRELMISYRGGDGNDVVLTAVPTTLRLTATDNGNETLTLPGKFTVTQSAITTVDTVLSYSVTGTATPVSDYAPLSGTVTIPAGANTAQILVPVIDDLLVEGLVNETVTLTLNTVDSQDPAFTFSITKAAATIGIIDNDPDDDVDGVSDETEDPDGTGYDGNADGTSDSLQENVTSLPNATNGTYVTIASTTTGTSLINVVATSNPSPDDIPAGVDFPIGFLGYAIQQVAPGGAATIQIFTSPGSSFTTYYKYGPTPTDETPHWYEFLYDGTPGTTGAEISGNLITLHLIDGQLGDDDLTANGVIVDPGAPAGHAPPIGGTQADAGGPYYVNEGTTLTLDARRTLDLNEPNAAFTFEWDLNYDGQSFDVDAVGMQPTVSFPDNLAARPIAVRVTDSNNVSVIARTAVTVFNLKPSVGAITAPTVPDAVNTVINVSAAFSDVGVSDTHTAQWDWGDDSTSDGIVTEENGSGTVSGSHAYSAAGVYTVTLKVTDDDGGSGSSVYRYLVAYDPSAGFVTGGGWINSPAGAYTDNPLLTGKANFGFHSQYKKGATVPTGNTEFQFKVADFNFKSTSYEWLVVSGAKARYRGLGTVNGTGSFGFELTAWDGQINGGGGVDRFRIKIWDQNQGNGVVYDNMLGTDEGADPTTALGGGSIVIHKNGNALLATGGAAIGSDEGSLTQESLNQAVDQAINYWRNTGINAETVSYLQQIRVEIANLSETMLGIASDTNYVWIDRDAAGYGWQLDTVIALPSSVNGRMDLLSVVAHELGHKLGLEHSNDESDFMAPSLLAGVRRLSSVDRRPADFNTQLAGLPSFDAVSSNSSDRDTKRSLEQNTEQIQAHNYLFADLDANSAKLGSRTPIGERGSLFAVRKKPDSGDQDVLLEDLLEEIALAHLKWD